MLARDILKAHGELIEIGRVEKVRDPITGDLVDTIVTRSEALALFESLRAEEKVLFPGTLREATVRVYLEPSVEVKSDDLLIRYPGTSRETRYKVLSTETFKEYKEVEAKEV